ncbi:hypothetical protein P3T76_001605 [Phytophthora citrophthora]|uniref:Helitron helicase-like domain-containing protein n=1 Tax=Phytophthora citrophthora TaxID=4793 RepID=A0AAD9H075_9STRA|nr:hypothetical protein P3T76_001605 [Phytophthora citrophthora]
MQQWCVDQAAKLIEQRLFFHRRLNTQRHYHRELFSGLQDMMLADHILTRNVPELSETGMHIVLSSSFPGGVRYMRQQYYDSMAIVRQFGKPNLFITVTTKPNWPEIQANLLPGQTASDRPDIVARVFKMKLKAILDDITKKRVFGETQAYVYVIEFQKPSLLYAHILVILKEPSKPRTSADYDKYVCAEIPDRDTHPELFDTISTCMIHGPCGQNITPPPRVGDEGKWSKRFTKRSQMRRVLMVMATLFIADTNLGQLTLRFLTDHVWLHLCGSSPNRFATHVVVVQNHAVRLWLLTTGGSSRTTHTFAKVQLPRERRNLLNCAIG